MIAPQLFEQIISGNRNDFFAKCSRLCLAGLEFPYRLIVSGRNLFYDIGLKKTLKIDVPVISIGNLTMGGTGKTPFVIWLVQKCLEMGLQPAVASRGYRADDSGWNDEAKELAFHFDNLPQAISPKRYTAIQKMLAEAKNRETPIDVVILDDGFQHRQLHRDLDIVLLDAMNPFGYNHVFPRGTLRESISSLKRADIAILSRSDFVEEEKKEKIHQKVLLMNPTIHWCEIKHTPAKLVSITNNHYPVSDLYDKNILAFCGIGNPSNFRKTLSDNSFQITEFIVFPDHFNYDQETLNDLVNRCQKKSVRHIICTMKDLIKIREWNFPEISIYAIVTKTDVIHGQESLEQSLRFLFK